MKNVCKKLVETFEDCNGGVLGCLAVILCLIIAAGLGFGVFCLEGYILMLLWNWLIVGFFGAPILEFWTCVGIMIAVCFIRRTVFGTKTVKVKTDDD